MSVFDRLFWAAFGVLSITFHISLIFSGLVPNLVSRPLHMVFALPWVLIFIAKTPRQKFIGIIHCIISSCLCLWIVFNEDSLGDQYGSLENHFQVIAAVILLLSVIEMARRAIGWPLPVVAVLALAYGTFGQYVPGEFGHPGIPLNSFLGTLIIAEGGIWGKLTGVSVNIVAIFVIFGAVLNAGEAGQGFMNVATAAAGRLKGGAAKVAVLSSALFGSISGSASANVASTGAITLPAMIKLKYPKSFAGAVEAVASSGGQIMPPLMGAGAFVMVELTGVSYVGIMQAAFLPALLYFFAVWMGINAFSARHKLERVPESEQPSLKIVGITASFFLGPFFVLLWSMLVIGFTPQYSACLATIVGVILLILDGRLTFDWRRTILRLENASITAGRQIATIAAIILCASIIIGVLGITGLGVKITSVIISTSGGLLWPALLLTALACLILGMEVPTTAAYVICVSVAGPALIELGLEPLQAHLFVFWFALLSTITPPVCGAVFIAAGMVDEDWLKVAVNAMALGVGLYLIPLGMIANPSLIQFGAEPLPSVLTMLKVGAGLALISYGMIKPISFYLRLIFIILGAFILFV